MNDKTLVLIKEITIPYYANEFDYEVSIRNFLTKLDRFEGENIYLKLVTFLLHIGDREEYMALCNHYFGNDAIKIAIALSRSKNYIIYGNNIINIYDCRGK